MPTIERKLTIQFEGEKNSRIVDANTPLIDLLELEHPKNQKAIVLASVNNHNCSLHDVVREDATVRWIPLDSIEGHRAYQQTLSLVLIRAQQETFPDKSIIIDHSLGTGLYCKLSNGEPCSDLMIKGLKNHMLEIIAANEPIHPVVDSCEPSQYDTTSLVSYQSGDTITCMGYPLLPTTGWLKTFDLKHWNKGMILCLPDPENINVLPAFKKNPKLFKVFDEYGQWMEILGIEYPEDLNRAIRSGEISDLIKIAEGLHEKKIASIADEIKSKKDLYRLILIAGPSSSGKTSFTKRLTIQLRVNGLRPISIGLDDYFLDRDKTPKDEDGNPDYESVNALDIPLFNQNMNDLMAGKTVHLPRFDFKSGKSVDGETVQLSPNQPVLIEGLHALNDDLTKDIAPENKYKIYVSALTQLNLTPHLRIPTSDVRLMRRLIRGHNFRGYSASETLAQWRSVRMGEERYIFPFQETADAMFNSSIIYELNLLKNLAIPLIKAVPQDNPCFPEAERIIKLLAAFEPLPGDEIPPTSILREFIGGSSFHY